MKAKQRLKLEKQTLRLLLDKDLLLALGGTFEVDPTLTNAQTCPCNTDTCVCQGTTTDTRGG